MPPTVDKRPFSLLCSFRAFRAVRDESGGNACDTAGPVCEMHRRAPHLSLLLDFVYYMFLLFIRKGNTTNVSSDLISLNLVLNGCAFAALRSTLHSALVEHTSSWETSRLHPSCRMRSASIPFDASPDDKPMKAERSCSPPGGALASLLAFAGQ